MRRSDALVLPQDTTACRLARAWTNDHLVPLGLDRRLHEDVILCVDELVANVVCHTPSSPVLTIRLNREIHVEVADTSADAAEFRNPGLAVSGGWGLRIVEQVADRWGSVANASGGKIVWFTVSI